MKSEMDAMGMDAHRRHAWLEASRVTLIIVGVTWIGMIVWYWSHGTFPAFLLAMVPVFALVRFAAYKYFLRFRPER